MQSWTGECERLRYPRCVVVVVEAVPFGEADVVAVVEEPAALELVVVVAEGGCYNPTRCETN